MTSNVVPKPEYVALLSAASVLDVGGSGALQHIAGQSLLGYQISALYHLGIPTFLIEVDTIPGELLNLADSFRYLGARVEFVRTAKDIQAFLKPGQKIVIQAEAHYFSASMVGEMVSATAPFIATVDGREENAAFERIDLNTRWAGFALIDASIARSMIELPEGWSMASSLLRLAIQHDVRFEVVGQTSLQSGDISKVSGQADADRIVTQMLADRSGKAEGFIEKHVFGQLAKMFAPAIWRTRHWAATVNAVRVCCAVGAVGLAMVGWSTTAAALAMLSVFVHSAWDVLSGFGVTKSESQWQRPLFWSAISASALIIGWTNANYGNAAPVFIMISAGLALIAQKIPLPRWASGLLKSPALLVFAMLAANAFSAIALGAKIIALAQLGLLIAALYLPAHASRNSDQA